MSDPLSESRIAEVADNVNDAVRACTPPLGGQAVRAFKMRETVLALIAAHDRLSRENAELRDVAKAVQAYADAPADDDGAKYRARVALWRAANVWKAGNHE